jgi:hypothetical protein
MSLPDYMPGITDPTRNLAGCDCRGLAGCNCGFGRLPIPTPKANLYRAWDGTPIGYGNTCDPITDEPFLSGLDGSYIRALVPDVLSENRIEWGDDMAVPLIVGVAKYFQTRSPLQAALWAVGGYVAPYPVAALVSFQAWQQQRDGGGGMGEIPGVRRQTRRVCYQFQRTRSPKTGKVRRSCKSYVRLPV